MDREKKYIRAICVVETLCESNEFGDVNAAALRDATRDIRANVAYLCQWKARAVTMLTHDNLKALEASE